jgi:protease-3
MKNSIQIIKSSSDKLCYRFVQLQNQMKCVLIKDQETKLSSAVMSVDVGSMQDPKEFGGMAHLVEHMLFMGKF